VAFISGKRHRLRFKDTLPKPEVEVENSYYLNRPDLTRPDFPAVSGSWMRHPDRRKDRASKEMVSLKLFGELTRKTMIVGTKTRFDKWLSGTRRGGWVGWGWGLTYLRLLLSIENAWAKAVKLLGEVFLRFGEIS
jgi:hypothetical protein